MISRELGVTSSYDLYRGRYGGMFPGAREKIQESWNRVSEIDSWTIFNVCGNIWELRKEWIARIVRPGEEVREERSQTHESI